MSKASRRQASVATGFVAGYLALAVVGALLFALNERDERTEREAFGDRAEVNARLVAGAAQPGVVFGDAAATQQAFAGLLSDPELVYVRVLDAAGKTLAGYPAGTVVPALGALETRHEGNRVHVSKTVKSLGGDAVGTVQVGFEDHRPVLARHAADLVSAGILVLLLVTWTGVHRAALVRNRMREQLVHSERLASLGRLSASVAHEINNPLSFIRANTAFTKKSLAAIAAGDKELLAEVLEAIDDTLDGVERVRRIVLDLKSYGRDEAETRTRADLRRIAARAVKLAGDPVRERASLVVTLADDVPDVRVDEGRMVQVFVNLLVNAAQALPEADPAKHRIELRVSRQGRDVVAEVQDTGSGIPEHALPRLFEPFFTTKAQGEGMGLGLYLCHSIVRSAGGQIAARNEARGCTFRIVLPAAPPASAAEHAEAAALQQSVA